MGFHCVVVVADRSYLSLGVSGCLGGDWGNPQVACSQRRNAILEGLASGRGSTVIIFVFCQ